MWKTILGFFTSSSIIPAIAGVVLAGGIAFGYNYFFVQPSIEAKDKLITEQLEKINEQGQHIGKLEDANKSLVNTIALKQRELEESIAQLQKLNDIITRERANAEAAETEIVQGDRDNADLEAAGKSEQVLAADNAQLDCVNANFGKPGGRCVKGKWTPD